MAKPKEEGAQQVNPDEVLKKMLNTPPQPQKKPTKPTKKKPAK